MFLAQIDRQSHSAAILLKGRTDGLAGSAPATSPPVPDWGRDVKMSSCLNVGGHHRLVGPNGGGREQRIDGGQRPARGAGSDRLRLLLLYGLGLLCLVATILPFHKDETWWVRACDFPRLQIATLTAVTLAGILAFIELNVLSSTLAFALLGCVAAQLAVILPYTQLRPVEVRKTEDVGRSAHPHPDGRQRVGVAEPPDRPAEGPHPGAGSRSGPRGRDRRVVVRAPGRTHCHGIRSGSPIRYPTPTG